MNWNEKIAYQLFKGNEACVQNFLDACQTEEYDQWLQKEFIASKHEILETMQFMYNFEDSDECSHDSDYCWEEDGDPYRSGKKSSSRNEKM